MVLLLSEGQTDSGTYAVRTDTGNGFRERASGSKTEDIRSTTGAPGPLFVSPFLSLRDAAEGAPLANSPRCSNQLRRRGHKE